MEEVRLNIETYDKLNHRIQEMDKCINGLLNDMEKLRHDHEEEIGILVKEGKVRVVEKPYPLFDFLVPDKDMPKVEYKGFEDIKEEVYEHFKKGLFKEELEKYKEDKMKNLLESLAEKDKTIMKLRYEVERLENRSLIARICNK